MQIGVPKEIKVHEYRVGLVPAAVRELVDAGNSVAVETGAGMGIGATDSDYKLAGASILPRAEDVFAVCPVLFARLGVEDDQLTRGVAFLGGAFLASPGGGAAPT